MVETWDLAQKFKVIEFDIFVTLFYNINLSKLALRFGNIVNNNNWYTLDFMKSTQFVWYFSRRSTLMDDYNKHLFKRQLILFIILTHMTIRGL